jgi:hypothetical protein
MVIVLDSTPVDISGVEVIVHNGLRRQSGTRYSPLLPGASFVESRLKEIKLERNFPILPGTRFVESRLKEMKLEESSPILSGASFVESRLKERKLEKDDEWRSSIQ